MSDMGMLTLLILVEFTTILSHCLHDMREKRMDRSIDKLKAGIGFAIYYLKQKDPNFAEEFEHYLEYLRNEE